LGAAGKSADKIVWGPKVTDQRQLISLALFPKTEVQILANVPKSLCMYTLPNLLILEIHNWQTARIPTGKF
jgi:hypothetical protein